MIRSVAPMMEKHHNVVVLDEAVEAAVKLSQRYVPARQLPDKAVSLLDTACARVAVSQHATPAQVEDRKRRVELLEVEREIVERERGGPVSHRRPASRRSTRRSTEARAELDAASTPNGTARRRRWKRLVAARDALDRGAQAPRTARPPTRTTLKGELDAAHRCDARRRRATSRWCSAWSISDAVAAVVGDWTGIPIGRMVKDEIAVRARPSPTS